MMPSQRDDDVAHIAGLLYDEAVRMDDYRQDYTIDDLRKARLRHARIRRALRLKEDT